MRLPVGVQELGKVFTDDFLTGIAEAVVFRNGATAK
jgi:hypothetical protein